MAVNHTYKSIFVHIPKTAGSSMETLQFVGFEGPQTHWSLNMFMKQLNSPQTYFKWCFSRNPYSRLVSAYNWGVNNHKEQYLKDINTFEDYIDKIEEFWDFTGDSIHQTRSGIHTIPQYIFINENKKIMDFIGKFENINEDFSSLCKKIEDHSGFTIPNKTLPFIKKMAKTNYMEYYNKKSINKINKLYEKDFILFDYEML